VRATTPGFLLGSPVQISTAVTVTHLSLIAKAGGPNVLLGLYRNSGGVPTTLVVGTTPTALVAGRMEIPVTTPTRIGGRYLLDHGDVRRRRVGRARHQHPNAPAMYAFQDFATACRPPSRARARCSGSASTTTFAASREPDYGAGAPQTAGAGAFLASHFLPALNETSPPNRQQ
jgi:hypothetical protein